MSEAFVTAMYGGAVLFVLIAAIIWGVITYRREVAEFLPSNVKNLDYDTTNKILTFEGGRTGKKYKYRGTGTVWYSMDGKRLDTITESQLSSIYFFWQYGIDNIK